MAIEIIYGIECSFPNHPNSKDIDGYGEQQKKQYFKRTDIPESFYDIDMDEDDLPMYDEEQVVFIRREWDRIKNGYWFFNKGNPTFITGDYYFYLNYWLLESGGYPEYRDADRKWFLFYEECSNDENILGIIRVKKRREGATSQASCIITKAASVAENTRCGIISKTGKDAEDLFQNMVVYGFRAMPSFLQPRTDGTEDPKKKLTFVKPSKKRVLKKGLFNRREGLNSFIEWRNTALNSFDSGRWSRLLIDESSKWDSSIPIQEYWNIAKKTLTEGARKVGFAIMVSTVNPPNSGGQAFKELWDDSDQFRHGRKTPSRLVRYFAPANEGYAGFIDAWGFSKSEEAKQHILSERASSKQDQDVRDYPMNEMEAFKFNDLDCHFNLDNIEAQEYKLKDAPVPLRRGRLYFDGNDKVQFADDKNGKWLIYKFPKKDNNFIVKGGIMYPMSSSEYGIGCDPFRHNITSGEGSMGSAWVGEKLDITNEDDTGIPIAHYYGRPKMKDLFWQEMLMASMWYGAPVTIEKDAGDDYYPYFQKYNTLKVNCLPMLGKKPDAVVNPDRKAKVNYLDRGIASADAYALSKQLEYGINYIEHHCQKIYYPELLDELKRYRHDNRTKFDSTVSFLIMLLTLTGQTKANAHTKKKSPLVELYSPDPFKYM
jgi:hypothetical protein